MVVDAGRAHANGVGVAGESGAAQKVPGAHGVFFLQGVGVEGAGQGRCAQVVVEQFKVFGSRYQLHVEEHGAQGIAGLRAYAAVEARGAEEVVVTTGDVGSGVGQHKGVGAEGTGNLGRHGVGTAKGVGGVDFVGKKLVVGVAWGDPGKFYIAVGEHFEAAQLRGGHLGGGMQAKEEAKYKQDLFHGLGRV